MRLTKILTIKINYANPTYGAAHFLQASEQKLCFSSSGVPW